MIATAPAGALGYPAYGLAMRFAVKIDGGAQADLGHWSGCTGLKVSLQTEERKSGGRYTHTTYVPGDVSYEKLTLERAMDRRNSAVVQQWLRDVVKRWVAHDGDATPTVGNNVTITLFDAKGAAVASWTLRNAIPVAWTGPSLKATGNDVAIEQLQFVHEGFL